jgi:signal recognition particle subunit SRP54
LFNSLTDSLKVIVNKIRLRDNTASLKKATTELRKSFLRADVHHKTTKDLITKIELETKNNGIGQNNFLKALQSNLTHILTAAGNQGFVYASTPLTTILMTGLQGSGKTTTTGKLALYLKQKNKKVLMAAGDLQRLAAVEQLKQLGSQIDVDVYFDDNETDPVQIALNAKKKAQDEHYDVLLFDTAGRLAIDDKLMTQLEEVKKVVMPNEIFYVADSLTGHDATKTATAFNDKLNIDGVILTKFDGDTKGGVALSIAHQVKIPLRFIGTGEKMPDLEVFIPERIVSRLMGAGDIEGLAEKTADIIDQKQAREVTRKIRKGEFNFNDFMEQLEMIKKLGSMKSLVSMIPGMSQVAGKLGSMDFENSSELKRIKALISSMTPKERETPSILNISRKKRLAKGAGLTDAQVNKVLKQFKNSSKMAKKLSGKNAVGMKQMLSQIGGDTGAIPKGITR